MREPAIPTFRACATALASLLLAVGCSDSRPGGGARPDERSQAHAGRPPLIVLISIDTLRADHMGLYGHHRDTSPVLDAFARGGTVFVDASSTSPWTLPAHSSMLTGLYPRTHRVLTFETTLPEEVPTLAGTLSQAGYSTAAVVNSAWLRKEQYGLTRDFQDYLFVDDAQDRRAPNSWVTDQAMVWIRERDTRPLFLFIHYYDVHSDYSSLPQYERLFVQPYSEVADGTGWQLARANRSIRRGRYKLIHNSKEDSWALYDLELDPGETLDIAAKEPEITAELSAEIRSRYAGFDPNPEPPNRIELDREELERLRALGYVP